MQPLRSADGTHDYAVGAFDHDRLIGVAQFDRSSDAPVADVAVEVAHDFQHIGLGTELLRRVTLAAVAKGVARFTAMVLADNRAVEALFTELGVGPARGVGDGVAVADIDLTALGARLSNPVSRVAATSGHPQGSASDES